jgi:hypothetical protein
MRTISLHLVNDLGPDSIGGSIVDVPQAWPGTPTDVDVTLPPEIVRKVWIGVSPDGSTNQVYPLNTAVQTILADGWTRIFQGTEIIGAGFSFYQVFSEPLHTVQIMIAACCETAIQTALFALKISNNPLAATGSAPPCGTPAAFKWLAVFGTDETRELEYRFTMSLLPADGDVLNVMTFYLPNQTPFIETVQLLKRWPADFVGMTSLEGITLVGPTAVPGVNERRVSFYDGGTVSVVVDLFENDDQIQEASGTWRLPGTICTRGCSTIKWDHNDNVFGLLQIMVNGEAIVYSTEDDDAGDTFFVNDGDEVEITVSGGDSQNLLTVTEPMLGTLFTDNAPPGPVTFTFTAACAKAYVVHASTLGGE